MKSIFTIAKNHQLNKSSRMEVFHYAWTAVLRVVCRKNHQLKSENNKKILCRFRKSDFHTNVPHMTPNLDENSLRKQKRIFNLHHNVCAIESACGFKLEKIFNGFIFGEKHRHCFHDFHRRYLCVRMKLEFMISIYKNTCMCWKESLVLAYIE